jgi:hypothetical protein
MKPRAIHREVIPQEYFNLPRLAEMPSCFSRAGGPGGSNLNEWLEGSQQETFSLPGENKEANQGRGTLS